MHQECIGSRDTERGRAKRLQLLSVLENSDWQDNELDRYLTTGLICGTPATEEMGSARQRKKDRRNTRKNGPGSWLLSYKSWSKESKQDLV